MPPYMATLKPLEADQAVLLSQKSQTYHLTAPVTMIISAQSNIAYSY